MTKINSLFDLIENVSNYCIQTFDVFKNHVFSSIDYNVIEKHVPTWIRDSGNSAESSVSKTTFEYLADKNKNVLTHKLLYYYDCEMLVASLQDRLSIIQTLVSKFYCKMPSESDYEMKDFDSATLKASPMDVEVFALLNSIFIYLGSSFDIITKIASELNQVDTLDFSTYPDMRSKNVQFGNVKYLCEELKNDSLFSRPTIVRKIESIRNRIVHNGSFDFNQFIYICHDSKKDNHELCILFPDFDGSNFISFKSRRNFYKNSSRINLILPEMLIEIFELLLKTITKLNTLYITDRFISMDDDKAFKNEIDKWHTTFMEIQKIKEEI